MHDHSRFQRDINDVTGVSLSLSLPLTKVTHAQYRKRFRASYNISLRKADGFGTEVLCRDSGYERFALRASSASRR